MGIMAAANTRVLCFAQPDDARAECVDRMRRAGTEVVAVVEPLGEPGRSDALPLLDTAVQAAHETGANAALVHVAPEAAADAMMEAIDAGLALIVCATRGVPTRDMVKVINYLQGSSDLRGPRHSEGHIWLLGPGSAGVITPGAAMVGTLDPDVFLPGHVGIVSRSNALAEVVAASLTERGIGQSTCLVTGSALIAPTRLADLLGMLEADPDTEAIVIVGGVGGTELEGAAFLRQAVSKPVVAYLAGRGAPPGINVGADGDFVCAKPNEVENKAAALREAGAQVVATLEEIAPAVSGRV